MEGLRFRYGPRGGLQRRGGAGRSTRSGRWGPTVLIVAGISSGFLACSFGAGSCRTQGPNLPPDPFLPGLSCREFLWHWQAPRHGCSGGSWLGERPKSSDSRPVGICRNERIEASADWRHEKNRCGAGAYRDGRDRDFLHGRWVGNVVRLVLGRLLTPVRPYLQLVECYRRHHHWFRISRARSLQSTHVFPRPLRRCRKQVTAYPALASRRGVLAR